MEWREAFVLILLGFTLGVGVVFYAAGLAVCMESRSEDEKNERIKSDIESMEGKD